MARKMTESYFQTVHNDVIYDIETIGTKGAAYKEASRNLSRNANGTWAADMDCEVSMHIAETGEWILVTEDDEIRKGDLPRQSEVDAIVICRECSFWKVWFADADQMLIEYKDGDPYSICTAQDTQNPEYTYGTLEQMMASEDERQAAQEAAAEAEAETEAKAETETKAEAEEMTETIEIRKSVIARGYAAAARKGFEQAGFTLSDTKLTNGGARKADHTFNLVSLNSDQTLAWAHTFRNPDGTYTAHVYWTVPSAQDLLNMQPLPDVLPEPVRVEGASGAKNAAQVALRDAGYDLFGDVPGGTVQASAVRDGAWGLLEVKDGKCTGRVLASAVTKRDFETPGTDMTFMVHVVRFDDSAEAEEMTQTETQAEPQLAFDVEVPATDGIHAVGMGLRQLIPIRSIASVSRALACDGRGSLALDRFQIRNFNTGALIGEATIRGIDDTAWNVHFEFTEAAMEAGLHAVEMLSGSGAESVTILAQDMNQALGRFATMNGYETRYDIPETDREDRLVPVPVRDRDTHEKHLLWLRVDSEDAADPDGMTRFTITYVPAQLGAAGVPVYAEWMAAEGAGCIRVTRIIDVYANYERAHIHPHNIETADVLFETMEDARAYAAELNALETTSAAELERDMAAQAFAEWDDTARIAEECETVPAITDGQITAHVFELRSQDGAVIATAEIIRNKHMHKIALVTAQWGAKGVIEMKQKTDATLARTAKTWLTARNEQRARMARPVTRRARRVRQTADGAQTHGA